MSQNYSLLLDNGDFPGRTKNKRSTQICLNYSLSNSLLSTLMIDVKKHIKLAWSRVQRSDISQNYSLLLHKGNFKEKTKNNKSNRYALLVFLLYQL